MNSTIVPLRQGTDPAATNTRALQIMRECNVQSFLREAIMNAAEAGATECVVGHLKPEEAGAVTIDAPKLYVVDNGVGMAAGDAPRLIGGLGVSSKTQAVNANFGVGITTASLAVSPYAVDFYTRVAGDHKVTHVRLAMNANNTQIGLVTFGDEELERLDQSDAPKPIRKYTHGTLVVIHGRSSAEDTTLPETFGQSGRSWTARLVNRRFWQVPDGLALKCTEVRSSENGKTEDSTINGAKKALEKLQPTPYTGTVDVTVKDHADGPVAVKVHWYLQRDGKAKGRTHGRDDDGSQIAVIKDGECYSALYGKKARTAMRWFGVDYTAPKVSLFIEVDDDWNPSAARNELIRGVAKLELHSIGAQFREKLPQRIIDAEANAQRRVRQSSSSDRFRTFLTERCAALADLARFYRLDKRGNERIDCDQDGTADRPNRQDRHDGGTTDKQPASRTQEQRFGQNPGRNRARPVRPQNPELNMVAVAFVDDADHVAEYLPDENLVRINQNDHRMQFQLQQWRELLADSDGAEAVLDEALASSFQGVLTEVVLHARMLFDSDPDGFERATSPEALSSLILTQLPYYPWVEKALEQKKVLNRTSRPAGL